MRLPSPTRQSNKLNAFIVSEMSLSQLMDVVMFLILAEGGCSQGGEVS